MLTIARTRQDGYTRLALDGELDMLGEAELAAAIREALPAGDVMIDCERLVFCDSSGIAVLLAGRQSAREAGADLWLTGVQGIVRRVLDVCGVLGALTSRQSPVGC